MCRGWWAAALLPLAGAGFGVGFDNIDLKAGPGDAKTLTWDGWGALTDRNWDDDHEICYFYTVIAWNEDLIEAIVDHGPVVTDGMATGHVFWNDLLDGDDDSNTTALKTIAGFLHNENFLDIAKSQTITILPRAFGFKWDGSNWITGQTDHDFQQAAYSLKRSAPLIEHGKIYSSPIQPQLPSQAHTLGKGFVSWETQAILKHANFRDDFTAAEAVSAVAGTDVGLIHPPFSIMPRPFLTIDKDKDALIECLKAFRGQKPGTEDISIERIIENVPFQHAVPVLLGWDVGFACASDDLKEVGVQIADFDYVINPGDSTGTLHVTLTSTAFGGDNASHENYARFNVGILGFKRINPAP